MQSISRGFPVFGTLSERFDTIGDCSGGPPKKLGIVLVVKIRDSA